MATVATGVAAVVLLSASTPAQESRPAVSGPYPQVGVIGLTSRVQAVPSLRPRLPRTTVDYVIRRAPATLTIDGDSGDWQDVPSIAMGIKEQATGAWTGPADLSGLMRMAWDDQSLCFCLEVRDDTNNAANPESKNWWINDCMQFAFDAYGNGPLGGYDVDELSYIIFDGPAGPFLGSARRRGLTRGKEEPVEGARLAAKLRPDGVRVLEWSMPWELLEPVNPRILGQCGMSFSLNDNDGQGFKNALLWGGGIIWKQDAGEFRKVAFEAAPAPHDAIWSLRAEPAQVDESHPGVWLDIEGVKAFDTGRLLVQTVADREVEACLNVYRPGEAHPVARGSTNAAIQRAQLSAIVWDLEVLPPGEYELVYEVPGIRTAPSIRLPYSRRDISELRALGERKAEIIKTFGLDQPFEDLAGAPDLIRKHRGLAAATISWMSPEGPLQGEDQLKALSQSAHMLEALDAGGDFLAGLRGNFWAAYFSRADGTGQFFPVELPDDYDPRKKYPLLLYLHGAYTRPSLSTEPWQKPCIRVRPWGRGDLGWRLLAENDAMAVVDFMKQHFPVDEDRIHMFGGSMGGGGAWFLASKYPDLFAAVQPDCGRAVGLPLENLLNVAILNQHGDADWTVPIDSTRLGVQCLQKLGYPVLHREYQDVGHNVTVQGDTWPWISQQRRVSAPAAVTWTASWEDTGAWWLRVLRLDDLAWPGTARASLTADGQALCVNTKNISVLQLDLARIPVTPDRLLTVQVNGQQLQLPTPLPVKTFLVHTAEGWSLQQDWQTPAGERRPYRRGAAQQLFSGEPLLIAIGSTGGSDRQSGYREAAEELAARAGTAANLGRLRICLDSEITERHLELCNLILIGGPDDNSLVARLAGGLNVTFRDNSLVAGGRKPVSLTGASLGMLSVNPLSQKHLLMLLTTPDQVTPEKAQKLAEVLWRFLPWDGGSIGRTPDLVVEDDSGRLRRHMQYGRDWQWQTPDGADKPAPEWFSEPQAQETVWAETACRISNADYAIGSAMRGQWYDPAWYTLADLEGMALCDQIVSFDLTAEELDTINATLVAGGEMFLWPSRPLKVSSAGIAASPDDAAQVGRAIRMVSSWHTAINIAGRRKQNLVNPQVESDLRVLRPWRLASPDATRKGIAVSP